MSYKLFHHSILSNARVWEFLKQVDATEAQVCRAAAGRFTARPTRASRTVWRRIFATT